MPVFNMLKWDRSRFFLRLIFIVAAALMFFLMALAYKNMQRVAENNNLVNHSMTINVKLEKLYSDLKDIETERRNFLLTGDAESKLLVRKRIREITGISADLASLFADNKSQEKNLRELNGLIVKKYKVVNESFTETLKSTDPAVIKQNLLGGRIIMRAITEKINTMLAQEEILLDKRRNDFLLSEKFIPVYLYIIALFSLGMIGFSFFKMNSDLTHQFEINRNLQISADTSDLAEKVAGYGTVTLDLPTNRYRFSDNFYRLLGYAPDEFPPSYAEFTKHVHPEDLQLVNKKTDEILAGESRAPFRFLVRRKDGEERIFEEIGKKIKDSHQQDIMLAVLRDITNEEKYKTDLAATNRELSFYNASSKEAENVGNYGFWRWDVKKSKVLLSDNVYKIFGVGIDRDMKPETLVEYIHPEDKRLLLAQLQKFNAGEAGLPPITYRIFRADDGQLRHIRLTSKLMEGDTESEYYLMFTQDITDEVLDKQLIEEKNHILEANNKELMAFNYVASHDLQEPLRKIETFISRLKEKDQDRLSESGMQYLERTAAAASRMRNLIADLLQFSRTARADLPYTKTDLNETYQSVKEEMYQLLEEKNAVLTAGTLPTVNSIPFQMRQLFQNLISNALKYSREGIPPVITITAKKIPSEGRHANKGGGARYEITFQDNGIGFEDQYSEKIFELFHRLHGRAEYEGTGIGLAICKKIVENHRGAITAAGTAGAGAKFIITLPESP